jgi:hypothetical protein
MQRFRFVTLLMPLVLSGCLSFSSSNPPPPNKTTVVVPQQGTTTCSPTPC